MPVLSVILPQRGLTKAHIMRILVILKECIFCTLTVLHQLPKCYTSFSGQRKRYQTQAKYKDTRHGQSKMFPELWIIQQPVLPWDSDTFHFLLQTTTVLLNLNILGIFINTCSGSLSWFERCRWLNFACLTTCMVMLLQNPTFNYQLVV